MIKFGRTMPVHAVLALLGLAATSVNAPAADASKSESVLDEIRRHCDGLEQDFRGRAVVWKL